MTRFCTPDSHYNDVFCWSRIISDLTRNPVCLPPFVPFFLCAFPEKCHSRLDQESSMPSPLCAFVPLCLSSCLCAFLRAWPESVIPDLTRNPVCLPPFVPLCLCAFVPLFVPLCLCAFPKCLCAFVPLCLCASLRAFVPLCLSSCLCASLFFLTNRKNRDLLDQIAEQAPSIESDQASFTKANDPFHSGRGGGRERRAFLGFLAKKIFSCLQGDKKLHKLSKKLKKN